MLSKLGAILNRCDLSKGDACWVHGHGNATPAFNGLLDIPQQTVVFFDTYKRQLAELRYLEADIEETKTKLNQAKATELWDKA